MQKMKNWWFQETYKLEHKPTNIVEMQLHIYMLII